MPSRKAKLYERRAAIEEIIRRYEITSQAQLLARLRKLGLAVTQSSVSRDLADMGIVRADGRYLQIEGATTDGPASTPIQKVAGFIQSYAIAGHALVVVKTPPGLAASVSLAVDREGWPEVIGTVAGDDTFFIAVEGRRQQARLVTRLGRTKKGSGHG
jgi:transcriptional regulator of arginine metabolism